METRKIVIVGELTDLNSYILAERSNRHAGAKIKKNNTELCQWQMKGLKPIIEPCEVICTWHTINKKKDPDNVAFAKKYILDALVRSGVLKNDGRKQIKGFQDKFETDLYPWVLVELKEVI